MAVANRPQASRMTTAELVIWANRINAGQVPAPAGMVVSANRESCLGRVSGYMASLYEVADSTWVVTGYADGPDCDEPFGV